MRRRARNEVFAYFGLTFLLTWGIGALIIFARPQLERFLGPLGQLNRSWIYFVAVYAPSISAVTLSFAFGGWLGLRRLFGGLVRPVRLKWLALAIFTYPAALLIGGLVERLIAGPQASPHIDLHALFVGAPALLFTTLSVVTDPGAFGEETGWRGFALPRLLKQFDPLVATLILGVVWLVWHIPAFFAAGLNQTGFSFGWFALAIVSLAVFMSWIYLHAGGNWLVAGVIPHALLNLAFNAHVVGSVRTEAVVLAAIAATIVALSGSTLTDWLRAKPEAAPTS
ncbi:MAG: CPBP family intramembrane glutamic endopeptidase [Caulobacteraceae bacterium]